MDILSHGLWGGAPFYNKSKKKFWYAFLFGIMPDLFAFVPNMVIMMFTTSNYKFGERPHLSAIPDVVFRLYDVSHSLFVFLAVFLIVFLIRKKPFWPMIAWVIHIVMDIPTHTYEFFPTPFLWPFSNFKVDGISWGQQWFLIMDFSLLAVLYVVIYLAKRWKKARQVVGK